MTTTTTEYRSAAFDAARHIMLDDAHVDIDGKRLTTLRQIVRRAERGPQPRVNHDIRVYSRYGELICSDLSWGSFTMIVEDVKTVLRQHKIPANMH